MSEESVNKCQILLVVRLQSAESAECRVHHSLFISPSSPSSPARREERAKCLHGGRKIVLILAGRDWHQTGARYQPNNGRFHPEYNCSLGQTRLDQARVLPNY